MAWKEIGENKTQVKQTFRPAEILQLAGSICSLHHVAEHGTPGVDIQVFGFLHK